MTLNFLVHLGVTLVLVGLIWVIQVVHYPLFERVGRAPFAAYHHQHGERITRLVAPLMLAEAATGLLMLVLRPPAVPAGAVWTGIGLLAIIWLSTAFLQVPRHGVLARGFDAAAFRSLVLSNWLRTAGWTARGLLVLWMTWRWLEAPA